MPASGCSTTDLPLNFETLRLCFQTQQLFPTQLIRELYRRIRVNKHPNIWIALVEEETALSRATELEAAARARGSAEPPPLFGIPFAVKDNIDVAGMPTTAACRGFAYMPERSSPVVEKLLQAGAILIGKTNLDQFATGLTGLLSSYGATRNAFNSEYISGGSSSGSAVAVSAGLVSFALGTDTAGSGRVPAAFNHLVGLKPTRGRCSTRGLFPACRSLDCLSFLTLNVDDSAELLALTSGFDSADPWSRRQGDVFDPALLQRSATGIRYGVPRAGQLDFLGDSSAERLYAQALARLDKLPGLSAQRIEVDITPFLEAGKLLYQGPWIAERYASVESFASENPEALHPITKSVLDRGKAIRGTDVFRALQKLYTLRRHAEALWALMDILVLPTAGRVFSVAEASLDPAATAAQLGLYTNFVNLLDLCGLALPAGFDAHGVPWGVSLLAPAFHEADLLAIGREFFPDACGGVAGKSLCGEQPRHSHHVARRTPPAFSTPPQTLVCVVGAHLSGQPLNHQLTDLGGKLVKQGRTAPVYRLYALAGTKPPKPGLVRMPAAESPGSDSPHAPGMEIEVEVWSLPERNAGAFLAQIPPPLCLGNILLQAGEMVKGFLCESFALAGSEDISHHGGWLRYLSAKTLGAGQEV